MNSHELNAWLDNILADKDANICIIGDTLNPEKYAYKIKQTFLDRGYNNLFCIDKELKSLSEAPSHIDLMILCMNPNKAYNLLQEAKNHINNVLAQPGANSPELTQLIQKKGSKCYDGCILVYWSLKQ